MDQQDLLGTRHDQREVMDDEVEMVVYYGMHGKPRSQI
jgi:hypothetical protein